jgi:hypothetical protein
VVNPFKHVNTVVGGLYTDASNGDCAPGPAKAAVIVMSPVLVPVAFISALFIKPHKDGGQ